MHLSLPTLALLATVLGSPIAPKARFRTVLKAGKIAPKPKPPIVAGLTGIHPVGVPVELPQPVPRNAQPRILAAKPPKAGFIVGKILPNLKPIVTSLLVGVGGTLPLDSPQPVPRNAQPGPPPAGKPKFATGKFAPPKGSGIVTGIPVLYGLTADELDAFIKAHPELFPSPTTKPVPRDLSDRDEPTVPPTPVDDLASYPKLEAFLKELEAEAAALKEQEPPTKRDESPEEDIEDIVRDDE